MKEFIKLFDIYPLTFNLKIKGKDNKNTFWGGVFSIIHHLLTLTILIYNLINFINNNPPIVSSSNKYIGDQQAKDINLTDFKFIFYLIDQSKNQNRPQNLFFNNPRSSISYNYMNFSTTPDDNQQSQNKSNSTVSNNNTSSNNNTNLTTSNRNNTGPGNYSQYFKKCTSFLNENNTYNDSFFQNINSKKLKFLNLSQSYCFSPPNENIKLGGDLILTQENTDLTFTFSITLCEIYNCSNASSIPTSIRYGLVLTSKTTNFYNTSGYNETTSFISNQMSMDKNVSLSTTFQTSTVYTDNNVIYDFVPTAESSFLSFNSYKEVFSDSLNLNNFTFSAVFTLYPFQIQYKRSFIKLDQIIANILSVQAILTTVLRLLVKLVEIKAIDKMLINKLYLIEDNSGLLKEPNIKKEIKKQLKKIQIKKRNSITEKVQTSTTKLVKAKNLDYLVQTFNLMNKKSKIARNVLKLVLNDFGCFVKSKFYSELSYWKCAEKYLTFDFDLITIGKKLIEFEKMKEIIFDDDQILLFMMNIGRTVCRTTLKDDHYEILNEKLYSKLLINNSNQNHFLDSYTKLEERNSLIDRKLIEKCLWKDKIDEEILN